VTRLALMSVLISLCGACTDPVRAERIGKLNEIADLCGLPRSVFELRGTDELLFQPSPETRYQAVDCALTELKKTGFPMKMGFVGNEAPLEPEE
jgi:hypothetical protein